MNKLQLSIAALLAGSSTIIQAADEALSPVIVTATRTAQSADESLTSVSVITREEIERSPSHDVAELLAAQAGISFSRTGGPGAGTSLYLRGTEADHTLVLIDGIRAASATTGQFSWETLRPEQIERIEIVRGPRTSLYGSDAIGGVINIFTRKQQGGYLSASAGSYGTRELAAGVSGGDRWRISAGVGSTHSDGLPTLVDGTDERAYDNRNATLRLSGNLASNTDLQLSATQSQGTSEHDPSTGDSDFLNRVVGLRLNHRRGEWEQSLLLGQALDEYTIHSPTTPSTITTRRDSASWQHTIATSLGVSAIGIDYWRDKATKNNSGIIDKTIAQTGLFAEQQWSDGSNDLQLALRSDQHDTVGTTTTGNIALGRQFDSASRGFISFGNAFKAPTVNDLYWPNSTSSFYGTTYITQGNPDLEPERSATLELGLSQQLLRGETRLNLYRTWTENLIDWQGVLTAPNEYTYQPTNLGRVEINGVELGLRWPIRTLEAGAQLTLLDAKDPDTGMQLDRRPRSETLLSLAANHTAYDWRVEWRLVGERTDRSGSATLPGYNIINASYLRRLEHGFELGVRLNNLFDHNYVLATSYSGNYSSEGRSGYLDLKYRF